VSGDDSLASVADEIDAIAERLADHALALLRDAVHGEGTEAKAAATERVVTRARRALERAAALLRGADDAG
jgi:hypothetical protein